MSYIIIGGKNQPTTHNAVRDSLAFSKECGRAWIKEGWAEWYKVIDMDGKDIWSQLDDIKLQEEKGMITVNTIQYYVPSSVAADVIATLNRYLR